MFELDAIGPQGGDRWTRPLVPGEVVRLGRAPSDGWAVPWDMRISREHCDIELKNDRLYVRCLDEARNPVYRLGEIAKQFTLFPGETFRIGLTTFRLNVASAASSNGARKYDMEVEFSPSEIGLVETDRVDGEVNQLRDEIASLRAQLQADASAKRNAAELGQVAREEVRMLRRQLDALKKELIAAQLEVERLQLETDGDITGSKEFQALRADIDKLREKVQSGEFLAVSSDSNRDDSGEESAKPESTEIRDLPKGLGTLRARLAAEAKERAKRRGSK